MIALLALKKLVNCVSVTEVFWDVRSDSVRAISVTLRSTATPAENSLVPTNSNAITGMIIANSTAARPLLLLRSSPARRRMRSQIVVIGIIALPLVRFVLERGRRSQQPPVGTDIREIEAEPGDEHRPLVEQPHDDDIARPAREIIVRGHEVLAGVDRVGNVDGREGAVALHVDRDSVHA